MSKKNEVCWTKNKTNSKEKEKSTPLIEKKKTKLAENSIRNVFFCWFICFCFSTTKGQNLSSLLLWLLFFLLRHVRSHFSRTFKSEKSALWDKKLFTVCCWLFWESCPNEYTYKVRFGLNANFRTPICGWNLWPQPQPQIGLCGCCGCGQPQMFS